MFRLSGGDGGADLCAESGGHYGHQNRRRKIHETLGNPAEIQGKSMEIWILRWIWMEKIKELQDFPTSHGYQRTIDRAERKAGDNDKNDGSFHGNDDNPDDNVDGTW